jgi:hypothetical protein
MGMKVNGSTGLVFPDDTTMSTGAQAVRAWVNFNGTGTVAIRAQFNVSSITDNGTGDYTVNFTTAMVDANYAAMGMGVNAANQEIITRHASIAPTTTTFRLRAQSTTAYGDPEFVSVAFFD